MRGTKSESMSFEQLLIEIGRAHGLKAAFSIILSWLGYWILPVAGFMAVCAVLVASDWITGVTAASMRREKITSRGLFQTIRKIVFYCLAIVLVVVVEQKFFHTDWIVFIVAAYIAILELYSNLENISSITGTNILKVVRMAINAHLKKFNIEIPAPKKKDGGEAGQKP